MPEADFGNNPQGTAASAAQKLSLKTALALDAVDNTSDADKPVSAAQYAALSTKGPASGIKLNGVDGQVVFYDYDTDFTGPWSIVLKIRTGASNSTGQLIYCMGGATLLVAVRDSRLQFRIYSTASSSGTDYTSNSDHTLTVLENTDYHIVVGSNGPDDPFFFVNAVDYTGNDDGGITAASTSFGGERLGARPASPNDSFFTGVIYYAARFKGKAISLAEAQELYNLDSVEAWLAYHPEFKQYRLLTLPTASNNSFTTFSGESSSGFTATTDGSDFQVGGWNLPETITSGKVLKISFDITFDSGTPSPSISLRTGGAAGSAVVSDIKIVSAAGSYTYYLSSTGIGSNLVIGDADTGGFTISNLTAEIVGARWNLPLNDGGGMQAIDVSGNGQLNRYTETGIQHLTSKNRFYFPAKDQDLSASQLLVATAALIPPNCVVTGLIIDNEFVSIAAINQTLTSRRIYCNNTAGTLTFSRTAGTGAGTTFATYTPVDDSNVDYQFIFERVTN